MGTLIGAPLGIALAAGVVLPAMVIGIPVYVGRQVGIKSTESQLAETTASRKTDKNFLHQIFLATGLVFASGYQGLKTNHYGDL